MKRFSLPLIVLLALLVLALPAGAGAITMRVRDGTFTRMFPALTPFAYTSGEAQDLANTMENQTPDAVGVNSGTADDSKTLAAWQTYVGQDLDHELDFDSTNQPEAPVDVSQLANDAAGVFNLATIFGRGPLLDPELYQGGLLEHLFHPLLKVQCTLGTPFDTGVPNVIAGNQNSRHSCE